MKDIKVTVASLRSVLIDPQRNLDLVTETCKMASEAGARILFLPELMLTGHGAHPKMIENAEPVPDGPLSQAVLQLSATYDLCICVGIAELSNHVVYNSQMVADRGTYLGLQRKVYLSLDEYCYFGAGEQVEVFDLDDVRFGVTICYSNQFPEMALIHALHNVDLILSPHAARSGRWPAELTPEFRARRIAERQADWEKTHRARASDHNVYVLLNNAVGPSTEGLAEIAGDYAGGITGADLENVAANHAGTVMGIDPHGDVFLRTSATDFVDEVATVELKAEQRQINHRPTMNRRTEILWRLLEDID
jgi:predicted amidohydrolase